MKSQRDLLKVFAAGAVALGLVLGGCAGDDGSDGTNGLNGSDGAVSLVKTTPEAAGANCTYGGQKVEAGVDADGDGVLQAGEVNTTQYVCNGAPGAPGTPGADGVVIPGVNGAVGAGTARVGTAAVVAPADRDPTGTRVEDKHGESYLLSTGEFAAAVNPKYFADVTITDVTFSPVAVGEATEHALTVDFSVKKGATAVAGLTTANMSVFKLLPAPEDKSLSFNRWVPYLWRSGRTVNQGYRESNGTFVNHADGTYTYTFKNTMEAMAAAELPGGADPLLDAAARAFDATKTHRVVVQIGGHSGATGEGTLDVVPDGSAVTETRNIIGTPTCKKCHGFEFHGHGGDRVTVEGCATCHTPGTKGQAGEDADLGTMIHSIHAGREIIGAAGPDGAYFDDPATTADETADNVPYTWGTAKFEGAFPAVIENCQACHEGSVETLAQVDNWKNVPSREKCGACHANIVWTAGTDHLAVANDAACDLCHPATGGTKPVVDAHAWTTKDIRNIPEFDVAVTVNTPERGYFVAGEAPVVSVVLKKGGVAIDHTTVVEDSSGEGCTPKIGFEGTECNETADGKFRNANMYLTGPRAQRIPVLATSARAQVKSSAEPFSLSAGASLRVVVDAGTFIVGYDAAGEDRLIPGDFTVTLDQNVTTAAELADWLMGDAATFEYNEREFHFRDRVTAVAEGGKVSLRSRATIVNPSIQVPDAAKSLGIFGQAIGVTGGASQLRARTTASNTDPKLTLTAEKIAYTLDPIDEYLPAGTYVINVEFADLGRGSTSASYRTPSIAVTTFQVGQLAEEKPIAGNCESCHWSTAGVGFVLDYPRHNKPFGPGAVDQCGGCHDYASAETTATSTWSTGGSTKPISKRVHSIHYGSSLNYPTITVDHEESVPGRNWDITFPMDVRNCESCHPAGTTSGTWARNPNRLACMGCHDSDAATAHFKLNSYDPTPAKAWSGDEEEACVVCH